MYGASLRGSKHPQERIDGRPVSWSLAAMHKDGLTHSVQNDVSA